MKNVFKFSFLALVISISFMACSSDKKSDDIDTTLVDSSTIAPVAPKPVDTNIADSVKKDTTIKSLN
ncbi:MULTISPECIES: hypothetical protein [Pedobacter]|uniref:hypothetical protein n=1 Tax=Pedobacter TaxID=84567 RepID=UPI002930A479|nr:hypothetical protein [Pedobacter aquatilis]